MNLTELWKASEKSMSHKPFYWVREAGKRFIENLGKEMGICNPHLIRTIPGRNGGTFAHWQIGLEYARYLSPELARICNEIVKGFVNAEPTIAQSVVARAPPEVVAKVIETAIDHTMPLKLMVFGSQTEGTSDLPGSFRTS